MFHWRMPPNIKNKTNSIYYLPHNKTTLNIVGEVTITYRPKPMMVRNKRQKKQNKQTWVKEKNLCIITTNEIAGKVPQHTSILNTVIE